MKTIDDLMRRFSGLALLIGIGYLFCCLMIIYAAFILFKEQLLARLKGDAERKKATALSL